MSKIINYLNGDNIGDLLRSARSEQVLGKMIVLILLVFRI